MCHSIGVFGDAVSSLLVALDEHGVTDDGHPIARES